LAKKKKKAEKPHREVTRRQLAKWQYQKRRQRIIVAAGITIIVAIVAIVSAGWYTGEYRPMRETIIRVNETEYNMRYFVDMLKFTGAGQPEQPLESLTNRTINNIVQNELIRQGALELGISISDDEVMEEIEDLEVPDTDVNIDTVRARFIVERLWDEYFEEQIPQKAEQRQVVAMLLESENQTAEVRNRLEEGESFTELAAELSLDFFSKAIEGDYGWHPESIIRQIFSTNSTADYVLSAEVGVLNTLYDEEVVIAGGYWLINVLDWDEEMEEAHVKAMLLKSEAEAVEVKTRLDAGDNFTALAIEFSQLSGVKDNEGDLGMVPIGKMSPIFDDYVFSDEVEPGVLSEPIRDDTVTTQGGYWLIRVLDEDKNREIEEDDRNALKDRALNEWVGSLWEDPDNDIDESQLTVARVEWAVERAMRR